MHRGRHSGLWDAKSKVIVHLTRQQMSLCLSVVYLPVFCYAGTLLTMTVTYDNETPDHDKDVYLLACDDDSLHTIAVDSQHIAIRSPNIYHHDT